MRGRTTIAALAALSIAGLAPAQTPSHELLLVADQGTRSVHRFDPITGAYFGAIGAGRLTAALDVAVDPATNSALIYEGSGRVQRFNIYTGMYLGQTTISSLATTFTRAQNGMYVSVLPNQVFVYNASGAFQTGFNLPVGWAAVTADVAIDPVGTTYMFVAATTGGGANNHFAYRYDSGALSSSGSYVSTRVSFRGSEAVNAITFSGNRFLEAMRMTVGGAPASNGSLVATSQLLTVGGPSWGHNYWTYVPGVDATNSARGRIVVYDRLNNVSRGTFGESVLVDPRGTAIILAPEPGTLLAIGAGLSVLVARRRRKI